MLINEHDERGIPEHGKLTQKKGSYSKVKIHRFKIPLFVMHNYPLWGTFICTESQTGSL